MTPAAYFWGVFVKLVLLKTGKAPVEAEINAFEGFLESCLEPWLQLTSLEERFEQFDAFRFLPIFV